MIDHEPREIECPGVRTVKPKVLCEAITPNGPEIHVRDSKNPPLKLWHKGLLWRYDRRQIRAERFLWWTLHRWVGVYRVVVDTGSRRLGYAGSDYLPAFAGPLAIPLGA